MSGRFEAGEERPQLIELGPGQDLPSLLRRDPEHAAEARAEVAVVAEAGVGRQGRDVALAFREPLERDAET